ncbi:outer membrane biogenesis protein BamB [Roseimaritima multifibrata]|uniref:Outer membrane biogenesis protein BamB n=1 Tax=Roseimaritima multifibrata TaxID=1930274 RepID=A0A517MF50_9BACT|nr:PQQ-binding-like beta-propeller repeat protein [Roseimaritima multifibrata]QDS93512.1 outer membrane biogenesis protein BamB [Roseimaritima multifibrata]
MKNCLYWLFVALVLGRVAEGDADEPVVVWRQEVGVGFSSFVASEDSVYTSGHVGDDDVVYCLDANDGKIRWQFAYPEPLEARDFEGGPTATPALDGDRLYALSRSGKLFCLDATDGEVHWKLDVSEVADVRIPGWGFSGTPRIVDEKLLLTVGEAGLALDKIDGSLIWKSADRDAGYASPVLLPAAEGTLVVFASGRSYSAVDLQTGQPRWQERWLTTFGCNAADPIYRDGRLFLSSGYNRGSALFDVSGEEPELIWKSKDFQNQLHGSILHDGFLYGLDGDMEAGARLKCVDWKTGEVRWVENDLRPGAIILVEDEWILLTDTGEMIRGAATPDGYQETSRSKVLEGKCWVNPLYHGGRLYCRSVEGGVASVELRD